MARYVWVLWSFSGGWGIQVLVVAVALGLAFGSGSTAVGIAGGVLTFAGVWFGFRRLDRRHFYTRERNRTLPAGARSRAKQRRGVPPHAARARPERD